jgi:hypothetical protein
MLYVGNPHAPVVLGLTLVFVGVYEMGNTAERAGASKLLWGLLVSLFSKPVVFLMLPPLMMVKETRWIAVRSLLIYGVVSLFMVAVPLVNPESISWGERWRILLDPQYVMEHLNIYKNKFLLNPPMKDATIHWLNLVAQSDYKLMNIEVFSLPVFLETLLPKVIPNWIFRLFMFIPLAILPYLPHSGRSGRLEALLGVLITISLSFFLAYNTVWEYQYTSVLPVAAMSLLRYQSERGARRTALGVIICASLFIMMPSLYVLVRGWPLRPTELTLIRCTRIVPALVMYCASLLYTVSWVLSARRMWSGKDASLDGLIAARAYPLEVV